MRLGALHLGSCYRLHGLGDLPGTTDPILGKKGIKKIIVEGGGTTNWYFFKEKLVDEIIVAVTPYVLGGSTAISLVEGVGFGKISNSFKLKKIEKIQNEVILHYVS